jgi:hypothetical protein
MAVPLSLPANPASVPWVWRAISSMPFVRGLLGIAQEQPAVASAVRDEDTSLTQAHLEVLK